MSIEKIKSDRKKFEENKPEFKKKEKLRIQALSSDDLFKEVIELAGGDDYDGCSTPEGEVKFPLLLEELETRLIKANFIGEPMFRDERYPIE